MLSAFRSRCPVIVRGGLVAVTVLAMMSVSACSPEVASPTPLGSAASTATPTPSTVPPPTSGDEAIAGASDAAVLYHELRSEIRNEHPADSSIIRTVAVEDAADRIDAEASRLVESGRISKGEITYQPDATASTAGNVNAAGDTAAIPNGIVYLSGCFDMSAVVITNTDGSFVPPRDVTRFVQPLQVIYDVETSNWLVRSIIDPSEPVAC